MDKTIAAYDLHNHSCWSYDARNLPEFYFKKARELGMKAFAITDHHNFDVIPSMFELAKQYPGVPFFTGAEFSAATPFGDMDFVCLGLPKEPTPALKELSDELHVYCNDFGAALGKVCEKIGIPLTAADRRKIMQTYRPDHVLDFQGDSHVCTEVLADYMVEHGVVSTPQEWCNLMWCEPEYTCFYPKLPSADRVAKIVHEAGGIILIAHPFHYFKDKDLKRMDALCEFANLDGIECAHPSTPMENSFFYRDYCVRHKMVSSGGSDTHGVFENFKNNFAAHMGPAYWLDELKERIHLWNC